MKTRRSQPRCVRCKGSIDGTSASYCVSQESDPVHVHRKCFECMKCTTPLNLKTAIFPKNSGLILCQRDFKDYCSSKSSSSKNTKKKLASPGSKKAPHSTVAPVTISVPEPARSNSSEDVKPIVVELRPVAALVSTADHAPGETEQSIPLPAQVKSEPLSPTPKVAPSASGAKVNFPPSKQPAFPNTFHSIPPDTFSSSPSMPPLEPSFSLLPAFASETPTSVKPDEQAKADSLNNNVLHTVTSCFRTPEMLQRVKVEPDASEELIDVEDLEEDESNRRTRRRKPTKTGKFRAFLTEKHKHVLEKLWEKTKFPGKEEREKLGQQLGLDQRQVQIWFQNMRSRERKEQHGGKQVYV